MPQHQNAEQLFLLEKTIKLVPGLIAVYSLKSGQYLFVNDSVKNLLGYKKEEFLNGGIDFVGSLVHPDDIPEIVRKNDEALKKANNKTHKDSDPIITFEYRLKHKNGSWRWLHTDGSVYGRDKKGKVELVMNISVDITERKESEIKTLEEVSKSDRLKKELAAIIEYSDDAIISKNLDGVITSWNKAAERIFGYKDAEAIGSSIYLIIPDELKSEEEKILSSLKKGEHIDHFETIRRTKLGKLVDVSISISPIKDSKGEIIGAAKIARDITEKKRMDRQKDDFIAVASHELKTPVTSIKAYTQILKSKFDKKGDKESSEQLGKMDSQVNKLTTLIRDLLDITKIESGKLEFNKTTFKFDSLVYETAEFMQFTSDTHKVIIKGQTGKKVKCDRDRLGQVITNLMSNAIKYSPGGDKVIVKLSEGSETVVFSIKDFGVGIAKDKQSRVFERFFRVNDSDQNTFPGLGLGLYISSEIIKRMGGKIWVKSTVGKGTIFSFSIPLVSKKS